MGFDGKVHRGVLVVNADVAASAIRIFTQLLEEGFPIRRMEPMESYDGDLNASLRADNTSAFNCRRPEQINAPFRKSPHANGRAIDINPFENPWKDLRTKSWSPSSKYAARTEGRGKILKGAWSGGPSRRRAGSGRTSRCPTTCTSTPGTRLRPSRDRPPPRRRPRSQPPPDEWGARSAASRRVPRTSQTSPPCRELRRGPGGPQDGGGREARALRIHRAMRYMRPGRGGPESGRRPGESCSATRGGARERG